VVSRVVAPLAEVAVAPDVKANSQGEPETVDPEPWYRKVVWEKAEEVIPVAREAAKIYPLTASRFFKRMFLPFRFEFKYGFIQ
jgi:hypothetical protein